MNKYLITYDLNDKSRDYTGLYESIKKLGTWWHYIDSAWIIKNTTLTPVQIIENLKPNFDKVLDSVLIIKIDTSSKSGWLPQAAWDWLNS